jgi:hypothetical protein
MIDACYSSTGSMKQHGMAPWCAPARLRAQAGRKQPEEKICVRSTFVDRAAVRIAKAHASQAEKMLTSSMRQNEETAWIPEIAPNAVTKQQHRAVAVTAARPGCADRY